MNILRRINTRHKNYLYIVAVLVCLSMPMHVIPAQMVKANNTLIVDCLLPGKVKQLGTRRVYLAKKRPVKTSANECGIRGGEYVKYDRANFSTALSVWQDAANLGDSEAQYYVGEIYEKGMGQQPDYDLAFVWYKKASKEGYKPAYMSLGKMYEAGLGVEKDLVKAMNLYRKASGLETEKIDYASVFENARLENQQEITKLRSELSQEKSTTANLSSELSRLQSNLNKSKDKIRVFEDEIKKQQSRIDQSKQTQSINIDAHQRELDLASARSDLNSQKVLIAALKSELQILKAGKSSHKFLAAEVKEAQQLLTQQQNATRKKEQDARLLKDKLEKLQRSLQGMKPSKQLKLVNDQLVLERNKLKTALVKIEKGRKRQNKIILKLENDLTNTKQYTVEQSNQYKFELEKTRQQLQRSEIAYQQKSQQYDLLQKEITALGKESPDMVPTNQLLAVEHMLAERGKYYENQIELLRIDLDQQKNKVIILSDRLADGKQRNKNRAEYIDSIKQKLSTASTQLDKKNQIVRTINSELEDAYQTIFTLQQKIDKSPKREDLVKLEKNLRLNKQSLESEKNNTKQLIANISNLATKLKKADTRLNLLVPKDGPVIALRWPKYDDNKAVKKAIVGAGSIVNIVGAVYPARTITEFTINGKPEKLDTNGLFLKSIDVSAELITLEIKATDDSGRTSRTSFLIEPTTDEEILYTGGGGLTIPKMNFGNYYALVIGNNKYNSKTGWPSLETAANDAQAIGDMLKTKYGYKVTLKLNATRDDLLIALEQMRKKLTDADNLLIYYAGHGYLDPANDRGYWIPVDGSTDSTTRWVSNADVTDQIRAMDARNVMVVADSCYAASLMRSGVVTLRNGLSAKKKQALLRDDVKTITRMALSAGGLQPVADSLNNSKHSVFANALLKVLHENKTLLDGNSLATQVGLSVSVATSDNVKQVPRYAPLSKGGHQGGEFYFVPKGWKAGG